MLPDKSLDPSALDPSALDRPLLERLPFGILLFHLDEPDDPGTLRLLYGNPAADEAAGAALSEEAGRTLREFLPDVLETEFVQQYAAAAREGRTIEVGVVHYGDETVTEGDYRIRAVGLEGRHVAVVYENVSEQLRMEQQLLTEREFLEAVLQSVRNGIVACDAEGRLTLFNAAAKEFHGLDPDAALDPAVWADRYSLRRADGSPMPEAEIPLVRALRGERVEDVPMQIAPEGQAPRMLVANGRQLTGPDGRLIGAVVAMQDETARRRAEEALTEAEVQARTAEAVRRSETRYRSLVRATAAIVWNVSRSGLIEEPLPEWAAYTGQAWEEYRGEGWLQAIHPDDRERTQAAWQTAVASETSYDVQHRVRREDGEYRWMSARGVPVRGADGEVQEWVGAHTDVHEQRVAEERLRESEELVRTIAENSTQALVMMDERGHVTYCNDAFLTMTGFDDVEIRSKPLHYLVHHHYPDGRPYPMEECPIDRALPENFDVRAHEDLFFRKDGSAFPVLCAASPIFRDGRPVSTVIEVRDMTEAREAEAALRQSEARYRYAARATNDAIWDWDLRTHDVSWNPAIADHFGWADAVAGTDADWWKARVHPEDLQRVSDTIHGVIDGSDSHWQSEYRFRRADGSYAIVLDRGTVVRDADGGAVRMVGAMQDITEQRAAEEALRQSEAEFRAVAESIPQLAWIAEANGDIHWYNQRWYEYTGTTLEEMDGWGWQAVHHPDHVDAVTERFKAAIAAGTPWEDTFPLRSKEGEYRWFLSRAMPLRDEAGNVVRWFGTNTDVTEQREASRVLEERVRERTAELHEAYGTLDAVLNGTTDLIVAVDRDYRMLAFNDRFNDAFEAVYGRRLREGMGLDEALPDDPEERARAQAHWDRALAGEAFTDLREDDFPGIGYRAFEIRYSPITADQGGIEGAVSVVRDVTDRRAAEDRIRESEERYRTLVGALGEGVVLQDADGVILTANASAEQILGLTADQLAGKSSMDPNWRATDAAGKPLPGERHPAMVALRTGQPVHDFVQGLRTPAGEQRWLRVNSRPLFRPGGDAPYSVVTSFADITRERRAAEDLERYAEELEDRNADLQQFAYVASHDLQEPLRMVSSFLQLLQRRYEGRLDDTADEYIGYAVDGAQRMQRLIQDLLAYSRVGTRGQSFEPVDLGEVATTARRDLAPAMADANARVVIGDLPEVMGDPTQLHQLLQNLLGNAMKFRHPERAPSVRVYGEQVRGERGAPEWRIAVEDNGIGLEERYRERVFQIFQRLHTREEFAGTGIGLAICKRIVERHGGRIWFESQPGEGTTFYFTLPERRANAANS